MNRDGKGGFVNRNGEAVGSNRDGEAVFAGHSAVLRWGIALVQHFRAALPLCIVENGLFRAELPGQRFRFSLN